MRFPKNGSPGSNELEKEKVLAWLTLCEGRPETPIFLGRWCLPFYLWPLWYHEVGGCIMRTPLQSLFLACRVPFGRFNIFLVVVSLAYQCTTTLQNEILGPRIYFPYELVGWAFITLWLAVGAPCSNVLEL